MQTRQKYTIPGAYLRSDPRVTKRQLFVTFELWTSNEKTTLSDHNRLSLLFIPGSQMTKEIWNYYVELAFQSLGEKLHRAITIDCVSHGDSALANGPEGNWLHPWTDLAKDNLEVVKYLRLNKLICGPLIAVGHSMGAYQTLFMANIEPELLDGLVLMDPVWGEKNEEIPRELQQMYMYNLASRLYKRAPLHFESEQAYNEFFEKKFFTSTWDPRVREEFKRGFATKQNDGSFLAKTSKEAQTGSYLGLEFTATANSALFQFTPVPVLILQGNNSDWNPPGSNERLAEFLPSAKLKTLCDGGHLVFFEHPREFHNEMMPFINEVYEKALERERTKKVGTNEEEIIRTLKDCEEMKPFKLSRL